MKNVKKKSKIVDPPPKRGGRHREGLHRVPYGLEPPLAVAVAAVATARLSAAVAVAAVATARLSAAVAVAVGARGHTVLWKA